MRELVEESAPTGVAGVYLEHDIAIASARRGGHDILIEGEGDEDNDCEEVDSGADSAHTFRYLHTRRLAKVAAAEACAHKSWAEPADHSIAEAEGGEGEGERGDEGLAVASKRVGQDGERRA